MSLEIVPGAENVVRFPHARRGGPEAETLHDIAPPHALVASLLEERGLSIADLHGAFRETTARQAVLLETQLGRDATILQLRAALDGHMTQAVLVCRQYQDAADAMIRLEVRVEVMRRTAPWRLGPSRPRWRGHGPRSATGRSPHAARPTPPSASPTRSRSMSGAGPPSSPTASSWCCP